MTKKKLGHSYSVESLADQREHYDEWAAAYEPELCAMGYRIPSMIAAVFARHVSPDVGPILDAGCGGGIQAEPLAALGYGPITGIDLSAGMLAVAKGKGIYADLREMTLGETLDFEDARFAAILSSGTITPKHAPAHAFDDLIRVARSGAPIIFSMRDDPTQDPAYPAAIRRLEEAGKWRPIYVSDNFRSMPYGQPDITHRIHVYEVSA